MDTIYRTDLSCCGCEVCVNVCPESAITMCEDAIGFRYPKIDAEKCIDCGACIKKCDFQKTREVNDGLKEPIEAYAAYHTDIKVLRKSQSGGVFTAFADYVFKQGGCVYGCIMDEDFNVRIVRGDTMEDIEPMRGSKYLQAETGHIYQDVKSQLIKDRFVLFAGTPCQVAGLKSYLGNSKSDKLITIDLICHGVPSVKSFKLYVSLLEKYKNIKVKRYIFRSNKFEWGHKGGVEIVAEEKGEIVNKLVSSKDDFYKSNYLSWSSLRPSCFVCKYANFYRVGDFTMGDYWGWEKLSLNIPTSNGLSVLLVNSLKWTNLLSSLNLELINTPIEIARNGNETFNHPSRKGRFWDEFMKCVANNDFLPLYLDFEQYKIRRDKKEKIDRIKRIIAWPLLRIRKLFNQS